MNNPYSAPTAELSDPISNEEYDPKVFAVSGRIGRLRYLAYSFSTMFLFMIVMGILAAVLMPLFAKKGSGGVAMGIAMVVIYIPIIALSFIMIKRRLNDLDKSGWLGLLMLVPLLNMFFGFYLMLASGSSGSNSYGPKPSKNSGLVIFASLLMPIIAVVGILAAIAIPAYQSYVTKAKNAQMQQALPTQNAAER